jgi:hypothetical protein
MFKIQLANNEYYSSKRGRVQHYGSIEKATAKIVKLGEIAVGATVVECKVKTAVATKEVPKEIASETKAVKVKKTKKAASKPEKSASRDKTKKNKKA